MQRYVMQRLLLMVPTILGILTLVFFAIRLAPGDPINTMLAENYTAERAASLRARLGLDQPLHVQYVGFVTGLVRGDLGVSLRSELPILPQLVRVVPYTAFLAAYAMSIALLIAIPAGVIAALKRNTWIDSVTMVGSLALVSVPNFYLGVLLLMVFSVRWPIFPVTGGGSFDDPISLLHHGFLPAIALAGTMAAIVARMTRSSMLEVLSQDYVRTAWAKGLPERRIVYRHALRNAFIPVMAVIGIHLRTLLVGSVVIEVVFSRPGLARLMVDGIFQRDYVLVEGAITIVALIVVMVNFMTDMAYGLLDPRIRYG